MSDDWGKWIVLVLTSSLVSVMTFLVIYLCWLKKMNRKLLEMQVLLNKVSSLFQRNAAPSVSDSEEVPAEIPARGRRIRMSVEGRAVEIVEVGGQEVVRFVQDISEGERTRILGYLRDEGFLS